MSAVPTFVRRVGTYYNDVTEWLSVGGDLDLAEGLTGKDYSETIADLRDRGVTHVLDLRSEWDDAETWEYYAPSIEYLHAPIVDSWGHVPDEAWFARIEDFTETFRRTASPGDRLYVHCLMGINRGPSAAMTALLHADPTLSPWEAFQMVRRARPAAGVIYAKYVGIRHIITAAGGWDGDLNSDVYKAVADFTTALQSYWTPERIQARRNVDFAST